MAFTNSQKLALFLLISSRSEFRFALERATAGAQGAPNPFPDAPSFAAALRTAVHGLNMGVSLADLDAIDQNHPFADLWVGPRQLAGVADRHIGNVTTDHNEIVAALQLDPLYTPDNPCPGNGQMTRIAQAIGALNL
jgi:hypothetical protein